jgi:L-aminoadipate-semialdehyde dehydrogenase
LAGKEVNGHVEAAENYAADAKELVKTFPASFPSADLNTTSSTPLTIFLTGVTGFLGAYLLRSLLTRISRKSK